MNCDCGERDICRCDEVVVDTSAAADLDVEAVMVALFPSVGSRDEDQRQVIREAAESFIRAYAAAREAAK